MDQVTSIPWKRTATAAVGGAALLYLLSNVIAEFIVMASVDPSQLDSRVSRQDFWLMMVCIVSLAISGLLLLVAYLDVLLLGSRFLRVDFYVAGLTAAIVFVWGVAQFATGENVPVFKSYVASHIEALCAGGLAAVLMLVLSRAWPGVRDR